MNPQVQRLQTDFIPASGFDVEARAGDHIAKLSDGNPVLVYEVILVRPDHIIARVIGPHKQGTPVKMQMPLQWTAAGPNVVDGTPYALYVKKDAEPAGAKGKGKAAKKAGGPKPKDGAPTKMSKCREIFKANPNLSKVDMLALFIKDAGCTPMGANTYHLTISKER